VPFNGYTVPSLFTDFVLICLPDTQMKFDLTTHLHKIDSVVFATEQVYSILPSTRYIYFPCWTWKWCLCDSNT